MKRFADSLVRQKGIKPPPGYKTSISICRKFLNEHAPKKADGETAGKHDPEPVSPAQLLYAKKIAQVKGLVLPDEAKASSAAMFAWIDANRGRSAAGAAAKSVSSRAISGASRSTVPAKRSRKRKARADAKRSTPGEPIFDGRDTTRDSLW